MFHNPVKRKLLEGRRSVGTWSVLGNPLIGELLACEGFDYIVVDQEHFPIGLETTVNYFQAITAGGSIPIARLPFNDHVYVKRALDAGAMGIIIPLIRSADDARRAVAYSRFPPLGERPYGSGRIAVHGPDYLDMANDEILVMLQIEHRDAVEQLDEILAVEGYDGCFVGPTDLALSMGWPTPSQGGCDELEDLVGDLARRFNAAGKLVGTVCPNVPAFRARVEQGYKMVTLGSDFGLLRQAVQRARDELRIDGLWPT